MKDISKMECAMDLESIISKTVTFIKASIKTIKKMDIVNYINGMILYKQFSIKVTKEINS